MKVLMLKDVKGVGQRGTIVEVKDGYAYNFLIPQKAAEQATPEKIAAHSAKQKEAAELHAKHAAALKTAIESLNGARISFTLRATEKGGLFKSLLVSDIARAIQEQRNLHIPEHAILLEHPLKQTGEHEIQLRAAGAESKLVVEIVSV